MADEPAKLRPEDIEALIELFDASDWRDLRLTIGDTEILLSKDPGAALDTRGRAPAPPAPRPQVPEAASSGGAVAIPAGWVVVRAPSLGTFYRAPTPGAPPYVEIGQRVTAQTEMCLIEVMKLFTAVLASVAGTVREVCVTDGQLVEYDQALFVVEPHG